MNIEGIEIDTGLPPLPGISNLGGSGSSQTSSQTQATSGASSEPSMASKLASFALFGGIPIQRVVVLVLGLLFIAAGIFAFKPVRETIVTTAKTGAKAAAAA